jgi:hypothetical protein
MRVVDAKEPPRRLPLGCMALENIQATLRVELDELERWREVAAAADYPTDQQSGGRAAENRGSAWLTRK